MVKNEDVRAVYARVQAGELDAESALMWLWLRALSAQEEVIFRYVCDSPGVSSSHVAERVGITQGHAGTTLGRLVDRGYLSRREAHAGDVRYFRYFVNVMRG